MNKINRWFYLVILFLLVLLIATILAYLQLIPGEIKKIPHYDSIGHFILFGILAFSLDRALRGRTTRVMGVTLPIGSTIIAIYAIIDESLQYYSTVRTFDLTDLACSLLGVITFCVVGKCFDKNGASAEGTVSLRI